MAVIRINFQSDAPTEQQWSVIEVGSSSHTAETVTIDVPSWSIVNTDGHFIECNGQITKVDNSISIRRE
jgi:hypothetical protein